MTSRQTLLLRGRKLRLTLVMLFTAAFSFALVPVTHAENHYPACGNVGALKTAVNNANTNGEGDYIGLVGGKAVFTTSMPPW